MGVFDNLKAKAGELVDKHGGKAEQGIDKAARFADKKTGGKHSDKIRSATDKAKGAMDKIGDKNTGSAPAPRVVPPTERPPAP